MVPPRNFMPKLATFRFSVSYMVSEIEFNAINDKVISVVTFYQHNYFHDIPESIYPRALSWYTWRQSLMLSWTPNPPIITEKTKMFKKLLTWRISKISP